MKELEQLLLTVDDDYLIGLTNKGTVKRARKDLEKTEILYTNYENIKVEEAVVSLAAPLGESKCSCPSRSICKHIIMAILKIAEDKKKDKDTKERKEVKEVIEKKDEKKEVATIETMLLQFPIEKAVKALKKKSLEKIIGFLKHENFPEIEETSVVTVVLKEDNIKVKLLEPIEHSSCSCHKKELCEHKAAAILYYKFKKKAITIKELQAFLPEEKEFDSSIRKDTAKHIKEVIRHHLSSGLSRMSFSVMDEMERFAIICHNAGLADFERDFRKLREEYELYFKRSSAFSIEELMESLVFLYQKANVLAKTEDSDKIRTLAGEFHSEYEYIGELTLSGVGERHFHSKTGYEGEIYYFLEETTKEWYTFTNARPIFYDRAHYVNKKTVPWNLHMLINQFSEARIKLKNAKATNDHRLSSSMETKAEPFGKSILNYELAKPHYYEDFEVMFQEKFEKNFGKELSEKDRLVFVQADTWERPTFDEIRQYFSMKLFDKKNHVLFMEVKYSKEEKYTIRYLERLVKYLEKKELEFPCFMGLVSLEHGFMKFYPIANFLSRLQENVEETIDV